MPQSQTFDVASAHSSHGPADTRRSDTVGGTGGIRAHWEEEKHWEEGVVPTITNRVSRLDYSPFFRSALFRLTMYRRVNHLSQPYL